MEDLFKTENERQPKKWLSECLRKRANDILMESLAQESQRVEGGKVVVDVSNLEVPRWEGQNEGT